MHMPDPISRREWLKAVAFAAAIPFLPATTYAAAEELTDEPDSSRHRILTCNILLDLPEQHGTPQDWALYRRAACMHVIQSRKPDIICLQEVGRTQNDDLIQAFPNFTAFGYPDPYVDRNPKRFQSIKNVILYSRERYEQLGAGIYWLSETPLIAGSRLRGTKLPRHVTWLRLRERSTGRDFRVLNTHFALEQPVRVEEAKMISAEAAQYAPEFPQMLAGDLNSLSTSEEHLVLTDGCWQDSYEAIHGLQPPAAPRKIDFIMMRGNIKPVAAEIIRDTFNGYAPSDHYFVSADLELPA